MSRTLASDTMERAPCGKGSGSAFWKGFKENSQSIPEKRKEARDSAHTGLVQRTRSLAWLLPPAVDLAQGGLGGRPPAAVGLLA
jgi:hypothetical protein